LDLDKRQHLCCISRYKLRTHEFRAEAAVSEPAVCFLGDASPLWTAYIYLFGCLQWHLFLQLPSSLLVTLLPYRSILLNFFHNSSCVPHSLPLFSLPLRLSTQQRRASMGLVPGQEVLVVSAYRRHPALATVACPGTPDDIKCCTKPSCQLEAQSGDCRWAENCDSGNTLLENLCPGPDAFRCCVNSGGEDPSPAPEPEPEPAPEPEPNPTSNLGAEILEKAKEAEGLPCESRQHVSRSESLY
jgi:hypothetical protein